MNSRLSGFTYVVPAFALLALVLFSPVFYGFWFSLFRVQYGAPAGFAGAENYVRLFQDPDLGWTFGRTLFFTAIAVGLTVMIALALAVWVHRLNRRRAFIVQMIVIIPWIISTVVATLLFRWVFVNDIGLAISLLRAVGINGVHPLNNPGPAMALLIAVSV
jgi:multiple sugar transport system permease protein